MTNERASVVVTTRMFTRRAWAHGDGVLNIGIKKRGCPAERHEDGVLVRQRQSDRAIIYRHRKEQNKYWATPRGQTGP